MPCLDKELLRRRFARHLATYDAAAEVQRDMARDLCAMFAETTDRREFDTVLELGCGTGLLTRAFFDELAVNAASTILIDLVPEAACLHANRAGADFIAGDLDTVEYPTSDVIISNAALQWSEHPETVFAKASAALSSGGIFAFSTFDRDNLPELANLAVPPPGCRTAAELTEALNAVGLTSQLVRRSERQIEFAGFYDLLRHFKATGVTGGTPSRRWTRSMLAELECDFIKVNPDHRFKLTYRPVFIIAEKD